MSANPDASDFAEAARDYARACVDIQLKNVMMPGGLNRSLISEPEPSARLNPSQAKFIRDVAFAGSEFAIAEEFLGRTVADYSIGNFRQRTEGCLMAKLLDEIYDICFQAGRAFVGPRGAFGRALRDS